MSKIRWFTLLILFVIPLGTLQAQGWRKDSAELKFAREDLHGQVVDFTANHGRDNRIWSRCLYERRDMYVYLPPNYQPCHRYPIMIWLHGYGDDEQSFLRRVVPYLDKAIASGAMPPIIAVAPDGTIKGEPHPNRNNSFFLNSSAGAYEDFVLQDVWDFVISRYSISPVREAHILAGHSTGGMAAYHHAIKHSYAFGVAVGVNPPLNLRWSNKKGYAKANFSPYDWGWRKEMPNPNEVIGRVHGLEPVRLKDWYAPLFGMAGDPSTEIAKINPIEMLAPYRICPGKLEMYVAYGGQDELNIDAQVESFLYLAKWTGLRVGVGYDRYGRHSMHSAKKFMPGLFTWLAPRVIPYSPIVCTECGHAGFQCECGLAHPSQQLPVAAQDPCANGECPTCPNGACTHPRLPRSAIPTFPVTLPDPNTRK